MRGGEMNVVWMGLLACALIYALGKWAAYYGATLGLLRYLGETHDDFPSAEEVRKLRDDALARRIPELVRRVMRL